MARMTLLRGMDRFNRVLACRDTFLTEIVREALGLARFDPSVVVAFREDMDLAAKTAKKWRLADWIWQDADLPAFPGFVDAILPSDFASTDPSSLELHAGRPRAMDAELLLVLWAVDGVFSLTCREGHDRLVGSEVFQALVGDGRGPARSTVAKYLDLISDGTRDKAHKALCAMVLKEELDSFEELTVDSTAVAANTAWPSESALIGGFLRRIHRLLERQAAHTGVAYESKKVARWLGELDDLHRDIALLGSGRGTAAKRKSLYRKLLAVADKTSLTLRKLLDSRRDRIEDRCIAPTARLRVDAMMAAVGQAFGEAGRAMESARRRVLLGETVAAADKVYSLADPDAYMIVKGDRDPVVGYKPQIGRSAKGFVTCFEVTPGNPADSDRLLPMVEAHSGATGRAPLAVSTDDGYTSAPNLDRLADKGVQVVSFSGAKGRGVLGDEIYECDAARLLRNERSAVESTMFTLKHKLGLRRFCRRGIEGVRADLSATVFAHNLWRLARVREAKRREEDSPGLRASA
ncbi:MAG: IS4/IS5 family transposase [Opitutae bacterium]|nr:IS4/IS5 family transposase [Opitutae bacterium]